MEQEVSSFQQGNWLALDKLWQNYQPLCWKLIKKYGREEKEELLSEMKVIFIQLLLEYRLEANIPLAGYLKSKLEKRVFNHLRKVWQVRNKEVLLEQWTYHLPSLVQEQSRASLRLTALPWHLLTQQQKKILQLIYAYGYSERETAKVLNVSPSRVNKVKKIALSRLAGGEQP